MIPQEAVKTRHELKRQINRATFLAARHVGIACDGDMPRVDRETAEQRANLAWKTKRELETSLNRINQALNA